VVLSGRGPQVVNEHQVVDMLDSLSLVDDDNEDHLSVDSDSSDDADGDPHPPFRHSVPSDSTQKDEMALVQDVPSSGSGLSGKKIQWSSSDRFRRGLFKGCVVDVSSSVANAAEVGADPVQRQQSTDQELLSGCDSDNVATVSNTGSSCKSHKKVTAEQMTTLDRVKACVCEWKTAEMVAFLHADPSAVGVRENAKDVSCVEEVNKDDTEKKSDEREEAAKLYERKVGEFYGRKPRVRFADTCKQVVLFSPALSLSVQMTTENNEYMCSTCCFVIFTIIFLFLILHIPLLFHSDKTYLFHKSLPSETFPTYRTYFMRIFIHHQTW